MNKKKQLELIKTLQAGYVQQLETIIRYKIKTKDELKEINFGSDTGTGRRSL